MTVREPALWSALDEPRQPVSARWTFLYSMATFGYIAVFWGAAAVLTPQLASRVDETSKVTTFGIVSALAGLAAMVSGPLVGVLSDRTTSSRGRRHPWILIGALATAATLIALSAQTTLIGLLIVVPLSSVFGVVVLTALTAALPDDVPINQRATVSAWSNGVATSVGLLVGTALVSVVVTGLTAGYLAVAALLVVLVLPFALLTRGVPLRADQRPRMSWRQFWIDPRRHPDFAARRSPSSVPRSKASPAWCWRCPRPGRRRSSPPSCSAAASACTSRSTRRWSPSSCQPLRSAPRTSASSMSRAGRRHPGPGGRRAVDQLPRRLPDAVLARRRDRDDLGRPGPADQERALRRERGCTTWSRRPVTLPGSSRTGSGCSSTGACTRCPPDTSGCGPTRVSPMRDSRQADFKVTNTPYGRDVLGPFVEAFKSEGLRVGFYYSLLDWHHPDFPIDAPHPLGGGRFKRLIDNTDTAITDETISLDNMLAIPEQIREQNQHRHIRSYAAYMREQVRELLTDFGKIDIIWYDFSYPGPGPAGLPGKGREDWESEELLALTRELQSDIIVNNRLDLPAGQADVHTPEQVQPRRWFTVGGKPVIWELCNTFGGSWGYHRDEATWKGPEQLIQSLINSVACGGNLLMNVGPTARGKFDDRALSAIQVYGDWLELHGRAIYGCTQSEFSAPPDCRFTQNGNLLYLHVYVWPTTYLHLDGLAGKVEYAQLLNDASEIKLLEPGQYAWLANDQDSDTLTLELPAVRPSVTVPVIELFLK